MTDAVLPVKVFEGSWGHTFVTGGVAALAGLMFGLDIGVISGALQFIGDAFHASDVAKEWIVSSMMFGAAAGAIGAGVLSFQLGRKMSLIIGAVLFVVSSLLCAGAWSIASLIVARVILGVAIGIAQRGGHRFGDGLLVGNPPFGPALRLHGARSHEAYAVVFQNTDHQPRLAAAGVESRCVNRFDCHGAYYSFTVNRPSNRRSNTFA